jgi:hypothetical protein
LLSLEEKKSSSFFILLNSDQVYVLSDTYACRSFTLRCFFSFFLSFLSFCSIESRPNQPRLDTPFLHSKRAHWVKVRYVK